MKFLAGASKLALVFLLLATTRCAVDNRPLNSETPDGGSGSGQGGAGSMDARGDVATGGGRNDAAATDARIDVATDASTAGDARVDVSSGDDAPADGPPRNDVVMPPADGGPDGAPPACDAVTCPNGCCEGMTCVPYTGQANAKCGTRGAACGACSTGQACAMGTCSCTPASCPGGCCDGTNKCIALAAQSNMTCGSAGNACGSCSAGQACVNGACSCGGTSCAGCCSNGTCATSSNATCGVGGVQCAACGASQRCSTQGKCVCDATSCPSGCCDANGQCQTSGNGTCGVGGASCQACGSGRLCNGSGQCVCNASSCPSGCCDANGQCRTSSAGTCGVGGASCQACGAGLTCNSGGVCVCTPSSCASGCCVNSTTCSNGQSTSACGTGGGSCSVCSSGQRCDGSGCVCDATSCPNGCCNGNTCIPYATQTGQTCGHGGAACLSCTGMNGCNTTNGNCGPANILFVSSTVYTSANFGGTGGADNACQQLAAAQGLPSFGSFMAYLSSSTMSAAMRIQNGRGWVRPDGAPVADTPAQLSAGDLYYPPTLNEMSQVVQDDVTIWTGTTSDGQTANGHTCNDWTAGGADAEGGFPFAGYSGWQSFFTLSCGSTPGTRVRLYCLQAFRNVSVTPPKPQGRLAFVSDAYWPPAGGINAADAKCQSEASTAGLGGTFRALVSTSMASAASRFSLSSPWTRPDGVTVFAQGSDLNSMTMAAPLAVSAGGVKHYGNTYVWTGSSAPNTAGATSTTCNNWTSSAAADSSTVGLVGFTRTLTPASVWGLEPLNCDFRSSHLYCLQQ